MTNNILLPQWLDNLIFNELNAKYCPSFSTMTNIDDDKEKTLNYLGTYFPRSYAESYTILLIISKNINLITKVKPNSTFLILVVAQAARLSDCSRR